MKIGYGLLLWRAFRRLKPPEELRGVVCDPYARGKSDPASGEGSYRHAIGRRLAWCRVGATIVKVQFRYNRMSYGDVGSMGPVGFEPTTYGL